MHPWVVVGVELCLGEWVAGGPHRWWRATPCLLATKTRADGERNVQLPGRACVVPLGDKRTGILAVATRPLLVVRWA